MKVFIFLSLILGANAFAQIDPSTYLSRLKTQNYYQRLGVPDSASNNEIKKAFRKLSKQFHPDLNPNDKIYTEVFQNLSEAANTLTDETKRYRYDSLLRYGVISHGHDGVSSSVNAGHHNSWREFLDRSQDPRFKSYKPATDPLLNDERHFWSRIGKDPTSLTWEDLVSIRKIMFDHLSPLNEPNEPNDFYAKRLRFSVFTEVALFIRQVATNRHFLDLLKSTIHLEQFKKNPEFVLSLFSYAVAGDDELNASKNDEGLWAILLSNNEPQPYWWTSLESLAFSRSTLSTILFSKSDLRPQAVQRLLWVLKFGSTDKAWNNDIGWNVLLGIVSNEELLTHHDVGSLFVTAVSRIQRVGVNPGYEQELIQRIDEIIQSPSIKADGTIDRLLHGRPLTVDNILEATGQPVSQAHPAVISFLANCQKSLAALGFEQLAEN